MIEHPAVKKINFTGSTAVGRKIARACGQNLKPCLMELGGKNSSIVCADANIETAVKSVVGGAYLNVRATQNLGQDVELTHCSRAKSAWLQIEFLCTHQLRLLSLTL